MIIGLAGAKHAGKNTVAKIIAEEFGNEFHVEEWSFAEDLKKSAAAALGVETDDPVAWAESFKEQGRIIIQESLVEDTDPFFSTEVLTYEHEISGREYLQYYGTEAHRDVFGDNFWVKNLLTKIDDDYEDGDLPRLDLITDLRFPNEAESLFHLGIVIRVNRKEVENEGDTHASEQPLPDQLVNWELNNNGTLTNLRVNTIHALNNILAKDRAEKVPF
jgi:hypothetical protein